MTYKDGVYFGRSNEEKPTDLNEVAWWFNIDNDGEHKLYCFSPDTKEWTPQG